MDILSIILTIAGLCLFETVSSIDNAVINAEVLSTMGAKARHLFLTWGLIFAVFIVRGLLPLLIVWAVMPELGLAGAFTATFSSDPKVQTAVEEASPILLIAGGTFLIFLFFSWLFLEEKKYALQAEKFFSKQAVWFYALVSVILSLIVWQALQINPMMAFGAVVGSTAFFITHGFRENAEKQELEMISKTSSLTDMSKLMYLMVIDATFSLDGVLGAFAFTLSVPLIIIGNGLGAYIVRELTVKNIDRIRKYMYLKNGAMYSICALGIVMVLDSFGFEIPSYVSPLITFGIVGYFFFISRNELQKKS